MRRERDFLRLSDELVLRSVEIEHETADFDRLKVVSFEQGNRG